MAKPSRASLFATALPMPREAPVTIAVFGINRFSFRLRPGFLHYPAHDSTMGFLRKLIQCIIGIFAMRITHLRQADLNLLVVFTALAEERNVTRAASRLLLSQ